MSESFPESDWKRFRKLREVALERFCERVLREIGAIAAHGRISSHERYLKIYRLMERRDEQLGRAFNDPRRSCALAQLATIHAYGLLSEAELLPFSPRTRETVEELSKPAKSIWDP